MSRYFEKISYEQFKKDIGDDLDLYNSIEIPRRSTKYSAGYDIKSIEDKVLKKGVAETFGTGLKVNMNDNEVLTIYSRSSFGYKYNTTLVNSVGIIDKDYYNNPDNEGHFKIRLINLGDEDLIINKGDKIAQGIFVNYLVVDNEKEIIKERNGGIGSTGK